MQQNINDEAMIEEFAEVLDRARNLAMVQKINKVLLDEVSEPLHEAIVCRIWDVEYDYLDLGEAIAEVLIGRLAGDLAEFNEELAKANGDPAKVNGDVAEAINRALISQRLAAEKAWAEAKARDAIKNGDFSGLLKKMDLR
jgi:hypothetical protein